MKALIGGLIAYALLGLYCASVFWTIAIVLKYPHDSANTAAASPQAVALYTDGLSLSMTTIGALVSSLVISVLAVTDPGTAPLKEGMSAAGLSNRQMTVAQILVFSYLVVWLICGLSSFVVGEMLYPNALKPLTEHGRAWIGLAVSAAYAYFGLKSTSDK